VVSRNELVVGELIGLLNRTVCCGELCPKAEKFCQVLVVVCAFGSEALAVKVKGLAATTDLLPMAARMGGALGVARLATAE
jgi:hypothetical protein